MGQRLSKKLCPSRIAIFNFKKQCRFFIKQGNAFFFISAANGKTNVFDKYDFKVMKQALALREIRLKPPPGNLRQQWYHRLHQP
jgi:hypothetical protein